MATLYVFNPEHDLALAVGRGSYTPPQSIRKIKKEKALLPALYADNSDFILIPSGLSSGNLKDLEYYPDFIRKRLTAVTSEELPGISTYIDKIIPWGWDHAVRNNLIEAGVSSELLPKEANLNTIRELSHRRTAIDIKNYIDKKSGFAVSGYPREIFSLDEMEEIVSQNERVFFKAPWSSSGRGIVVTDHITFKGLKEWCHGILKSQGSIIADPAWKRTLDFASEWVVTDGKPCFLGWAAFLTSDRGKYHGNLSLSQNELRNLIKDKTTRFAEEEILNYQYEGLSKFISPFYDGYLGIDMLADEDGKINPCVEINLRITMGHVALNSVLK